MNSVDIFVIIIGAIAGYLIVSHFISGKRGAGPSTSNSDSESGRENASVDDEQSANSWETVLEISSAASADEIRHAYRTQMSKYHPDKVASLGKEFKSIAERKAKEINAAYLQAMKNRGVSP